jgi:hypothetical protein
VRDVVDKTWRGKKKKRERERERERKRDIKEINVLEKCLRSRKIYRDMTKER